VALSRLRERIILAALLGAVLVLGAVLTTGGYFANRVHDGTSANLDALLADLRARGEPVALEDMSGPPLAEADDGAPLLREAWESLDTNAPESERPTAWMYDQAEFDALPEDERARRIAFVATMEPFLSRVREAVERPEVRVWGRPLNILSTDDDIPRIQATQRLLTAALHVCKTPDERVRDLRAYGLLGARLERPHRLIQSLVAIVVTNSALHALRECLERSLVPAETTREALEPLLATDVRARTDRALRAARVKSIAIVRTMVGDEVSVPEYDGPIVQGWMGALGRSSLAEFITEVQEILEAAPARWSDLGRATVALEERMHPDIWRRDPGGGVTSPATLLMQRVVAKAAKVAATQSLARLSIAALVHFDASGEWPGSLDEIDVNAEHRIDPLTDQPLVFERLPDGIRLSSPGYQDREAWGTRVEKNDPEAAGLVWTLRR